MLNRITYKSLYLHANDIFGSFYTDRTNRSSLVNRLIKWRSADSKFKEIFELMEKEDTINRFKGSLQNFNGDACCGLGLYLKRTVGSVYDKNDREHYPIVEEKFGKLNVWAFAYMHDAIDRDISFKQTAQIMKLLLNMPQDKFDLVIENLSKEVKA